MEINDISDNYEGRLLLMAISKISTESQTNKTPSQILNQIIKLAKHVYKND